MSPSNLLSKTPARALTKTQKTFLRGLAHPLRPIVMIGHKGVTENVLNELDMALSHHELVKVKLSAADHDDRDAQIAALVVASSAEIVQTIGHVLCLYRRNPDEPKLALPR